IVQKLVQALGGEEAATEEMDGSVPAARSRRKRRSSADPGVVVKGVEDVWVKLARCCTPVPGDPIIGFVTRGSGVSVHRSDCVNVDSLSREPERILDVEWAPTQSSVFLVAIQVEALDRSRLLSDVTRVLSDQHVNILSAAVQTSRDRVATSRFTFEMGDPKHLGHVLKAVRGVEGVYPFTAARNRTGGPGHRTSATTHGRWPPRRPVRQPPPFVSRADRRLSSRTPADPSAPGRAAPNGPRAPAPASAPSRRCPAPGPARSAPSACRPPPAADRSDPRHARVPPGWSGGTRPPRPPAAPAPRPASGPRPSGGRPAARGRWPPSAR